MLTQCINFCKTFYRNKQIGKYEIANMKFQNMALIKPCTDKDSPQKAADLLSDGQVIGVPTDTVYGLACSANCPEAIQKLYVIKGRDAIKPVAICVTCINDVRQWGKADHLSDNLLNKLVPGPITIILERTSCLSNPYLNPQTAKIGIRIPNHNFINATTKLFDMPIALTSANCSNEPSALSVKEFEHLYPYLGAVFDGGTLSNGLEQNRTGSTVIDLSQDGVYHIIRKGTCCKEIVKILENDGWKSK